MKNLGLILIAAALLTACSRDGGTKNGSVSGSKTVATSEGTINGGGGIGIQCGDQIQTLDIYEATQAGLKMVATPGTEKEAVRLVSELIANHFWNPDSVSVEEMIRIASKDIIKPIFEGRPFQNHQTSKEEAVEFVDSLTLSKDIGNTTIPSNCSLVQIAYFSDENTNLKIVKSIWNKLDWLSKAVLVAHEVIYLVDRRDNVEKFISNKPHFSGPTRKFVGQLFSTTPPPVKSNGLPFNKDLYYCSNHGGNVDLTYFYVFTNPKTGKVSAVFNAIINHGRIYQIRANFNKLTIDNLINLQGGDDVIKDAVYLKYTGLEHRVNLTVELTRMRDEKISFKLLDYDEKQIGKIQELSCAKFTR